MSNEACTNWSAVARASAAYGILGAGFAALLGFMKGTKMDKCSVEGCKNYPMSSTNLPGYLPVCSSHWRLWEADERAVKLNSYLRDAHETVRFWQCRVAGVMTEADEVRIEGKFEEALITMAKKDEQMREYREVWLAAHKVELPAPAEPTPVVPPTDPSP